MATRVELIRVRLTDRFGPTKLEVQDQSHLHAGHAGAASGKGHFQVTIVADAFEGVTPITRHRMIYEALDDLMETDIHALSIHAFAPAERP